MLISSWDYDNVTESAARLEGWCRNGGHHYYDGLVNDVMEVLIYTNAKLKDQLVTTEPKSMQVSYLKVSSVK